MLDFMSYMQNKIKSGLVSVIIPTYNSKKYLPQSIESALAQTYPHVEIIVIDDGSTDNTKNVIEPYLDRITYLYKKNGGPASARNLGIDKAHGEYIAFLDADDYWFPEKLTLQVDFLKKNPQYALLHSNNLILEKGRELYPRFLDQKPPSGNVFDSLFLENHISNLTVIVRRECLEAAGRFDESRELISIEDYEFGLRIAASFEIGFLDEIVAVYRVHDSNISDPAGAIEKQLYLLDIFTELSTDLRKSWDQIITEKREVLYYSWACNLMEKKKYREAKKKFTIAARRNYLQMHSVLGILSCLLRTNILFRSRNTSFNYKHYANYLLLRGDHRKARKYFRAAIRYYPLQKIVLNFLR